jgi:hypothetical protein
MRKNTPFCLQAESPLVTTVFAAEGLAEVTDAEHPKCYSGAHLVGFADLDRVG